MDLKKIAYQQMLERERLAADDVKEKLGMTTPPKPAPPRVFYFREDPLNDTHAAFLLKADYYALAAENQKLKEALREFDNDDNWLLEAEYIDRNNKTGGTDFVFIGKWDPRCFATAALKGEPLDNTKAGERKKLSPFYTPDQKITNLYREKEKLKADLALAVSIFKSHLSTMNDINADLGYPFSQPLIAAREKLAKIGKAGE